MRAAHVAAVFGLVCQLCLALPFREQDVAIVNELSAASTPTATPTATPLPTVTPVLDVDVVHVIQTCHLDVGFAALAAGELNNYHKYFLQAIATANDFRQNPGTDGEGLVFTTHSYLVSLLLDCPPSMGFSCPTEDEKETIRQGLKRGDIVMQAFPFNSEVETFSEDMFVAALNLTKSISADLSLPAPITMTQRDVPGSSIATIPLLVQNGIKAYSGGVNQASLPPHMPRVFVWRSRLQPEYEVLAMLHPFGYGGINITDCVVVPGLRHAMCPDYKDDNQGPWSRDDIVKHWQHMRAEFPNAKIMPSSFDAFVTELDKVRHSLPVLDDEMGDTWLYGVPSDPLKLAKYRAMSREYSRCLTTPSCDHTDPRVFNFTRLAIKNSEHTWGGDVKLFLGDTYNWDNPHFHAALGWFNFINMANTWREQRDWGIRFALEALGDHPLRGMIEQAFEGFAPNLPELDGYTEVQQRSFDIGNVHIAFSDTGALSSLITEQGGWDWASDDHVIGQFVYQVQSTDDFYTFFNEYAQRDENGNIPWFFPLDFGKPGLYGNGLIAHNMTVLPRVVSVWQKNNTDSVSFVLNLTFDNSTFHESYGAPDNVWVNVTLGTGTGAATNLDISLLLLNKTATRLPESLWFRFRPRVPDAQVGQWRMSKLSQLIDPLSVITNGSRHLHAIDRGVSYSLPSVSLHIDSLDAAVVSWGDENPFPTPSGTDFQPDLSNGASFCLFANEWGTNYIMWYPFETDEADIKYRFRVRIE